jgi:hypothetical protein
MIIGACSSSNQLLFALGYHFLIVVVCFCNKFGLASLILLYIKLSCTWHCLCYSSPEGKLSSRSFVSYISSFHIYVVNLKWLAIVPTGNASKLLEGCACTYIYALEWNCMLWTASNWYGCSVVTWCISVLGWWLVQCITTLLEKQWQ